MSPNLLIDLVCYGFPVRKLTEQDTLQKIFAEIEKLLPDKSDEEIAKEIAKKFPFPASAVLSLVAELRAKKIKLPKAKKPAKPKPKKVDIKADGQVESVVKELVNKYFSDHKILKHEYRLGRLKGIESAVRKFGEAKVKTWFKAFDKFIRINDPAVISTLEKNKDVFEHLVGSRPDFPTLLYRGVQVDELPDKGQPIVYDTTRPYSSWTTKKSEARKFAKGLTLAPAQKKKAGMILAAPKSEISKQRIIFWPAKKSDLRHANFGKILSDEQEWLIRITKPITIKAFQPVKV